jgi:hypothetical protein
MYISLFVLVSVTGVMIFGCINHFVDDFYLVNIVGLVILFIFYFRYRDMFYFSKNKNLNNEEVRRTMLLGISTLLGCIGVILVLPGYFIGWYWQFQLDSIVVGVLMTVVLTPFIASVSLDKKHFEFIGAIFIIKVLLTITQLLPLPSQGGDHTKALLKLYGEPTASNFTPASVASYTQAFSGFIKPEGAEKLLSGQPVNPNDYWMLLERDSIQNPIYRMPKYFVFYKGLVIFQDDWSILNQYEPIEEGNDYAIYSIPSKVKINY